MNFREEYKNSIEIMSPSAEQMARMKKNILEQAKAPEKKAIPFKKIAYIGSAVAACAVISVAAINIIPRLSSENSKLTATESYANMAGAAVGGNAFEEGAYENAAMDAVADHAPEYVADGAVADYDYDMDLDAKSDGASFNDAVNEPSFEPIEEGEATEEPTDDVCCDDAVADEVEMPDAPTSAPVTTTAVDIDSSTDTPAEDTTAIEDIDIVEISEDCSAVIINDVKYVLIDDGTKPHGGNVTCSAWTSTDGTEYWMERFDDGYMSLWFRDTEGLAIIGGYRKETASFSTSAPNDTDEPRDTDDEPSFILSDDLSELVYDDVKYILYDETGPVDVPVIECMNIFDANGTEYWLDFSSEDYLLLSRDNGNGGFDLIGGYMKSE